MSYDREDEGKIGLTIEDQLERYTQYENSTDRHDALWHGWKHNKRWMEQVLEWIILSFPNYSRHDKSHVLSVLHNIEMLLGREVISRLSASDCFLILNTVYIHDIGMYITESERKEIVVNDEFKEFLETRLDEDMKRYADVLLKNCEAGTKYDGSSYEKKMQNRLDIYYAILYLSAEYQRLKHGSESKNRLAAMVSEDGNLGTGFSTSGIPGRFFYTIASCAEVHTYFDFDAVLELAEVDGGYAHDLMHPRFVAVLLQLGDALDLDNDRFLPLVRQIMGQLPHNSEIQFNKHKSVRKLLVSPEKIVIGADCETPDELRLVKSEIDNIRSILKNAGYNWAKICPRNLKFMLPVLEVENVVLKGEKISDDLVDAKFEITQQKAFNLLQGSNIYKNDKYIFLREIFQNAIDASKRQYWKDWQGSRFYREQGVDNNIDGNKPWKYIPTTLYPIEVEFHLAVKDNSTNKTYYLDKKDAFEKIFGDEKEYNNKFVNIDIDNLEYGVVIRVADYGTGITKSDILKIANMGDVPRKKKIEQRDIPGWLSPTAEFGIGLQSVFLVAKSYKAYSHARNNEIYEIEFNGTGSKGNSYINVMPKSTESGRKAYGTTFEVLVPVTILNKSSELVKVSKTLDPFISHQDYEVSISKAREVVAQLIEYLNGIIGEKLFPITVKVYDYQSSFELKDSIFLQEDIRFRKELYIDGKKLDKLPERKENAEVSWIYHLNDRVLLDGINSKTFEDSELQYNVDIFNGRLSVYGGENDIIACISAKRLLDFRRNILKMKSGSRRKGTIIYYKGIYVSEENFGQDLDLLEYIDVKGNLDGRYIAVNRSEFTEDGKRYIKEKIYPMVLELIKKALEHYSKKVEYEKICEEIDECFVRAGNQDNGEDIHSCILGLTGMGIFARLTNNSTFISSGYSGRDEESEQQWTHILNHVSNKIKEFQGLSLYDAPTWTKSGLYNIRVYPFESPDSRFDRELKNIVEILNYISAYAIASTRNAVNGVWEERLFRIESVHASVRKNEIKKVVPVVPSPSNSCTEVPLSEQSKQHEAAESPIDDSKGRMIFNIIYGTIYNIYLKVKFIINGEKKGEESDDIKDFDDVEIKKWEKSMSWMYGESDEEEHITKSDFHLRTEIERLKGEPDKEKRMELQERIESWPVALYMKVRDYFVSESVSNSPVIASIENIILNWILDNMPSAAVFFSKNVDLENNMNSLVKDTASQIRINVMDNTFTNSIYLNMNMKASIYKRMAEYYENEGITRFSMPVFTSFCQLAVKSEHQDVFFVKRGKINTKGRRTMIVPLSGKSISNLFNVVKDSAIYRRINIFEELIQFINEGFKRIRIENNSNEEVVQLFRNIAAKLAISDVDVSENLVDTSRKQLAKKLDQMIEETENEKTFLDNNNGNKNYENLSKEQLHKYFFEMLNYYFIEGSDKIMSTEVKQWMKEELLVGWKMITLNDSELMEYLDRKLINLSYKGTDIKPVGNLSKYLRRYFAFDESAMQKSNMMPESEYKYDRMKAIDLEVKNALIQYVSENNWIGNLSYNQIRQMYEAFVEEMMECIIIPVKEKIIKIRRLFQIKN